MKASEENNVYVLIITNSFIDRTWHQVEEFATLVTDAGYKPVLALSQKVETPNPATYLGSGFVDKVNEALRYYSSNNPEIAGNLIVATGFDLTGTQRANLKKRLGVEVIDRTFVILKIFENNHPC